LQHEGKLLENDYAFATLDGYPVSEGHALVISKRHFSDYFDITHNEQMGVHDIIKVRRKELLSSDSSIEDFNVGANLSLIQAL
jgi:ATP adenylyltransferase